MLNETKTNYLIFKHITIQDIAIPRRGGQKGQVP